MSFLLSLIILTSRPYHVTVQDCHDGDTCRINIFVMDPTLNFVAVFGNQIIRLCDINAPEVTGSEKEQGAKTRDFLKETLFGAKVVTFKPALDNDGAALKDKYGRLLGWLFADDVEVNQLLVEQKLAAPYKLACPK